MGIAVGNPMEAQAEAAVRLLSALAHPKRLLVLCHLVDRERSVGELAGLVGLSQTALSQHLGKMRAFDLVATRRDGQTIFYRLASPEARAVIETLYGLYCRPAE